MSGNTDRVAPTERALLAFAKGRAAVPLPGGMDTAWRAGDVVLKPSPGTREARVLAESHTGLAPSAGCRFQRPVPADQPGDGWEVDGWVAWRWIEGETGPEHAREIVLAARAYHTLLEPLPFDPVLALREDPWGRADRVAWGEMRPDYPAAYLSMLAPFLENTPSALPSQRVHADLTGNVVFSPSLAPGIIDPTLYWRPIAFAEAVVLIDQSWFASTPDIRPFADTPELPAMVRRAAARRIAEQPEQVAAHGKDPSEAIRTARQIANWADNVLNQLEGS